MAEVPVAPIRTVEQQGLPSARVDQSAPIAAFGGGESLSQATNASQNLAGQAGDLAAREIDKTNQIAVNDSLARLKQQATTIQLQAQQLKGQDALGAQDFVDKQWKKVVENETGSLSNGAQQRVIGMHATDMYSSMNDAVQKHVFQQKEQWDDQATSALIDNSKTHAIVNAANPDIVQQDLQTQTAAANDWARRKGVPLDSDLYKQHLTDILSATHTGVIQAQLDAGNTQGAEGYFAQNKDTMAGADVLKISKAIEQNKDVSLGIQLYGEVKGYKLQDGRTPDEGKMEADIMDRDDLTDEKKLRMVQFVKARAKEDLGNMYRADQARDEAFKNQAIKGRQAGMTLEDALKQVTKYSIDPSDQAAKENAIQKMYAPPDVTDVHTKVALWNGIETGTANKSDFDNALQKGLINEKDYFTGTTELNKAQVEGRSPQMRVMNAQIKELARTQFGNDADKVATFQDTVNEKAMGKSADEKWKIANDEMKTAPGTGSWFFGWGAKSQYQVDGESGQASSLALGKATEDLGSDTLRSLKAESARQGQPLQPAAIESLAQQFGGYDNLRPGQPVGQAMQLLRNSGQRVTPANIQAVFDHGLVKGLTNAAPPTAPQAAAPAPTIAPSTDVASRNNK